MAFVNMHIYFFLFLHFDTSLLLLTVTLRGVSNKHCLLSLFSFPAINVVFLSHHFLQCLHGKNQISDAFSLFFKAILSNWLVCETFQCLS